MKTETNGPGATRRGIRRWPAVLIVCGMAARLAYVWFFWDVQRQYKVMGTVAALMVGIALLLVWLMAFSRLPWRKRWVALAAVLGVTVVGLVIAAVTFRFEGVTGDLVPIFEPRWKPRARPPVAASGEKSPGAPVPASGVAEVAFPQFLGPHRDGAISGRRLAGDWSIEPPALLWRKPVGEGWGGFAVVGRRALTQEQHGAEEAVVCYELETGRQLWAYRYAARYDNPIGGIGPRATPTVQGTRVYAMGATGVLNCLDLETGGTIWGTNLVGEVGAEIIEWGISSSPLVLSNQVVVSPRGTGSISLVAVHPDTGEVLWKAGDAAPHYSSPRLDFVLGVPQILTFTESSVSAHEPRTGEVLWQYPWRTGHPHVTDPRAVGTNRVLISSGYGTGSHLVEVERDAEGHWSATNLVWRSIRLKSKFANILIDDGFAYGLDDGRLVCLDLADGSRKWDGPRFGHGQLLLVGDRILLTAENGEVVLAEARTDQFREVTRFRAVEGKTWNPPALAGEVLLVRNDREAAAYRLPVAR